MYFLDLLKSMILTAFFHEIFYQQNNINYLHIKMIKKFLFRITRMNLSDFILDLTIRAKNIREFIKLV